MSSSFSEFKQIATARPALIVPAMIMLIFSLFNLTAPPDPARAAAAFNLGIVNLDEGLTFPPIRVSSRVLDGLSENLPFKVIELADDKSARSALEAGEVAAVVLFAQDFSKSAISDKDFEIEVWNAHHLTVTETQIAAQLPMMIEMAMSAGVANLRLALAKGRIPSGKLPVTAKVETFHMAVNSTVLVAPFVMNFATWLGAFVGAMLLFQATKPVSDPKGRAKLRTLVPIASLAIASFMLALVVAATTGQWGLFLSVWLNVWLVALCLGWLFVGLFSALGMISVAVILPVAFYQAALGGTMAPVAAAPNWLGATADVVPFDLIGRAYRGVMHGADGGLPLIWLGSAAVIGLALIWAAGFLGKRLG